MPRSARLWIGGAFAALLLLCVPAAHAQQAPSDTFATSVYDQHAAFDPSFMAHAANAYRNGAGHPGPRYWQNRADYTLKATLDTAQHRLSGTVRIHYVNNSPDSLHFVWLQLDENRFRADSRSRATTAPTQPDTGGTQGYQFTRIAVEQPGPQGRTVTPDTVVSDTRMQLRLPRPIAPQGGTADFVLDYHFTVPRNGRLGWENTPQGPLYDIGRWYPRMSVYDDVRGWDMLPFLGQGEFYNEYGDFDYQVTVPANMIVGGAGELVNPEDVLTAEQQQRLDRARRSTQTVPIVAEDEVGEAGTRPKQGGTLTWHFKMENTRDVAWAASPAYVWDAARIDLPAGGHALAMSFYPPSAATPQGWSRSTEMIKATIEIFSEHWYPYPWPTAVNVAGPVGGMEYPGLAFCDAGAEDYALWYLTSHELGHSWFPMIVGSNERRAAWMDEGFNTFIDVYAHEAFNGGEFAPKRDGEYAPEGGPPAREIVPALTAPDAEPVQTYADVTLPKWRHPFAYYKPALGLVLLREYVLGPRRFDYAFRRYIRRWAFKHPTPADFYRTMDNAAGEDLRWFWKGWFEENWLLDQAVTDVTYVEGDPARGALITLENRQKLPMPVTVKVAEAGGQTGTARLPVEVWQRGGTWQFRYDSHTRIDSVIVDPERQLPDIHPENNVWTPGRASAP